MSLNLSILTPEGKAFEGEIEDVVAPGVQGSFAVLNSHAPLIAALEAGTVKVRQSQGQQQFKIDQGLLEVHDNDVAILADHVEQLPDE
jgi:F-type H+-transporting ATPase subunit epsilon